MKQETIDRIRKFTEDRDWDQFHSPANLAKSIVIEAAELLECFQWNDEEYDIQHVKEELADVIVYCQNLMDKLEIDADEIINMKMSQNEAKYPVEKAKGSAAKYDQLQKRQANMNNGVYIKEQLPKFLPKLMTKICKDMPKYVRKSEKSRKVKRLEKPENTGNMRKIKILFICHGSA